MTECPNCGFQLTPSNLKRATRLPADWQPDHEMIGWAKNERPDLTPILQAQMFRDFWHAKAGKDGAKLDWAATWRNWIRNARATPQSARPITPACHAPAPREGRKPQTVEEMKANQARLAQMLGGLR